MPLLTAAKVKTAGPGKHHDGQGLFLRVYESGSRCWVLRLTVDGRRREIGLGGWPDVSLADARKKTFEHRAAVADGRDPFSEKRRADVPTFRKAAKPVYDANRPRWRSEAHTARWWASLENHAFPVIGDMAVDRITQSDVLGCVEPIWTTRPEAARKVRTTSEEPDPKRVRKASFAAHGLSIWKTAAFAIAVLAISISCDTDANPPESDHRSTISSAPSESGAPEPLAKSPDSDEARPSPSPTTPSAALRHPDPGLGVPAAVPTLPPTAQPAVEEGALSDNSDELSGVGSNRSLLAIPVLGDSYLAVGQPHGAPFNRDGPMPERIIASTNDCRLLLIDSVTKETVPMWNFPNVDSRRHHDDDSADTSNAATEEPSSAIEAACDYIEDLEWADPSYLLINTCCEPVIGGFEIINTSLNNRPHKLGLVGDSPSVNDQNVLLYSIPHGFRTAIDVIGSIPFNPQFFQSESGSSSYDVEPDHTLYALEFSVDKRPETKGFVNEVSWVGDSEIAFELWTIGLYPELFPFIGLIDIASKSITFKSSGEGWSRPTGDAQGNLVVAEQRCTDTPNTCNTQEAKIVVLDPETLTPLHETPVADSIADMDLSRGWLLVTFSNGQMGTLDLADGTFSAIADDIINAVWME